MRKVLAVRCFWMWFAGLVCAAAVLLPAIRLEAQAAAVSEFSQNVKEVYFPFNVYKKVNPPSVPVLDSDAAYLKQHSDTKFWIEGYADIRGDIFYNLVLSYRRAQMVKTSLIKAGVNESQIGYATGWGKLYPTCAQKDDACFQQNRRVDMVLPELLPPM